MRTRVATDHSWGDEILSTQQLGRKVSRQSWMIGCLAVGVVLSSVADMAVSRNRPLLLDTRSGVVLTDYKTTLESLSVEERALIARSTYEGLRRRTGISSVDGQSLETWLNNITSNGANAWEHLGKRWANMSFVQPGFSRTIQIVSVKPDKVVPYAFTIEAIEGEAEVGKPKGSKSFRVRLTLFFSDPADDGVSRLDGVDLHEEELV